MSNRLAIDPGGVDVQIWRRAQRQARIGLAGLDRRMLADIGITRADVRDAFSEPFWDDPTALLRERALERGAELRPVGREGHPAALVRDADTGEVVAILSGGRQAFTTRAQRFDLVLSNGVTGRSVQVRIQE